MGLRKALILALLLSFALITSSVASETTANIPSSVAIDYSSTPSSGTNLVILSDDFETTQLADGKLTGWPEHTIEGADYLSFSTEQAHSGARSVKVTAGGAFPNLRVYIWSTEKEFWMQQWVYFADDFHLVADNKWFSLGTPIYEWKSTGTAMYFTLQFLGDDMHLYVTSATKTEYIHEEGSPFYLDSGVNLHRGEWVKVVSHVIRDRENGLLDVYVNDNLVIHYVGVTLWQQENFMIQPIKHYCKDEPLDAVKTVYFDDIEVWTD